MTVCEGQAGGIGAPGASGGGLAMGLIFFSSRAGSVGDVGGGDPYDLLLACARFADQHGFAALWVPERHFTADGWLYPNPSVVAAALSRETDRIALRAGSVVVPLHHPARIAEEWAVVDQLSGGRVGVSFASGWHPNDFVFHPERYDRRRDHTEAGLETVRALWRGDPVVLEGGRGPVRVRTFPRPVQPELPVWLTAAGNPATFARAGELGANLLTHLFNQTVDELADNIDSYRAARRRAGHDPATGVVTAMVHTCVTPDARLLDTQVRPAFREYLKSASYLLDGLAASRGQPVDVGALSGEDLDAYAEFVLDRLVASGRVLLGSPEACREPLRRLHLAGVDEVACQVDFGPPSDVVLAALPALDEARRWAAGLPARAAGATRGTPAAGLAEPRPEPAVAAAAPGGAEGLAAVRDRCREALSGDLFYERLERAGVEFGSAFRGVRRLWRRDGEALGEIEIPAALTAAAPPGSPRGPAAARAHPALLDACLQVLVAARPDRGEAPAGVVLPVGLRRFEYTGRPGPRLFSHAVVSGPAADGSLEGDVTVLDQDGAVVATATGLRLRGLGPPDGSRPRRAPGDGLAGVCYEIRWEPSQPVPVQPVAARPGGDAGLGGHWLVLADGGGVADALAGAISAAGGHPVLARPGTECVAPEPGGPETWRVRPDSEADLRRLLDAAGGHPPEATGRMGGAPGRGGRPGGGAGGPWRGVVYLWGLDAALPDGPATGAGIDPDAVRADLDRAEALGAAGVLRLVRDLAARPRTAPGGAEPPRLWLVTRGAQRVRPDDGALSVAQAPLWGFGRALAYEHPELWGGLVDLDPAAPAAANAGALGRLLAGQDGAGDAGPAGGARAEAEDEIAVRRGRHYAARLFRAPVPAGTAEPVVRSDGAYLITGGLGDLGLLLARRLAERGARHLILLGRAGLPDRASGPELVGPEGPSRLGARVRAAEALRAAGVEVVTAAVDVADPAALSARIAALTAEGRPPVRGVAHLAAEVRGGLALGLDDAALADVLRPKARGAWLLHRLLGDQELDWFVLFSAVPACFGPLGRGAANYAAANAFLDALAGHRAATGRPALSIGWGPWAETGLAHRARGGLDLLARHGVGALASATALDAFDRLLAGDRAHTVVAAFDWPAMAAATPALTRAPLLRGLPPGTLTGAPTGAPPASAPASATGGGAGEPAPPPADGLGAVTASARAPGDRGARDRLLALPAGERSDSLRDYTREVIAAVLGIAPDALDVEVPLDTVGLDSLMAIELKSRLEDSLGVRVPMVAFLQGPSVRQLAAEFAGQLASAQPAAGEFAAGRPDPPARPAGGGGPPAAEPPPAAVDQLSDADVDEALSRFLGG